MSETKPTVLVIDDAADLRASIGRLLRSLGINIQLFVSPQFRSARWSHLPGAGHQTAGAKWPRSTEGTRSCKKGNPFITGHGDIPMSVQAMKGGAIEFLTKPFRDQDLLDAIHLGLSRDRVRLENEQALADLKERFASLSPREREIVIQVARGRLSKQIAHEIGIAEATVKVHRSRAMQKMKASSLPELGRMADKLQLVSDEPQRS